MKNDLISCPTCSSDLAKTAETCPKCGAKNSYVHPFIKSWIDSKPELDIEINYKMLGDSFVGCHQLVNKVMGFAMLFAVASFIGLFAGLFFSAFGSSIGAIVWRLSAFLGMPICGFLFMIAAFYSLGKNPFRKFKVEIINDKIDWSSDDDLLFAEVKKSIESHSLKFFKKAS